MTVYEVYFRDYRRNHADKIAILPERRGDLSRQDGMKWARDLLGKMVRDIHGIFVLKREIG